MKTTIDMAREAGACDIASHGWTSWVGTQSTEFLKRFEALVRVDEREACLNCYSPDDTATDWADKIRARGNT